MLSCRVIQRWGAATSQRRRRAISVFQWAAFDSPAISASPLTASDLAFSGLTPLGCPWGSGDWAHNLFTRRRRIIGVSSWCL